MIAKKHEGECLLQIDNVHVTSCGAPPSLDADDTYVGYLENCYGEQWVFIGDRESGTATIRGGDLGWEEEVQVSVESPCPNMILNDAEKFWIITCFMAMANKPFNEVLECYNKEAERIVAGVKEKMDEEAE